MSGNTLDENRLKSFSLFPDGLCTYLTHRRRLIIIIINNILIIIIIIRQCSSRAIYWILNGSIGEVEAKTLNQKEHLKIILLASVYRTSCERYRMSLEKKKNYEGIRSVNIVTID